VKLRGGEWIVVAGASLITLFAILVGTLIYLKPPPVKYMYRDSALAQRGEAIFKSEGCGACHKVLGNGATYGPSLDGVGSRRSAPWLKAYLLDPRPGVSDKPYRARMPSSRHLSHAQLDALVAHLRALEAPAQPSVAGTTPTNE
jgi:cbb3-type cytochrome oxidase cytochrome c subunit